MKELETLKNHWKNQDPATDFEVEKSPSLHHLKRQLRNFEQQEGGASGLIMALVMGGMALLALVGAAIRSQPFLWGVAAMMGLVSLFQLIRYGQMRRYTLEPDQETRTFLYHSWMRIRWYLAGRYLNGVAGAGFALYLFGAADWNLESLSPNFWIAMVSFFVLAVCLMGLVFWFQKKYLFDTFRIQSELKQLLREFEHE